MAQIGIALAGFPREPFARALMIAWADISPGREMLGRGKLMHLDPDFRQDALRRFFTDPRDGH